MTGTGSQFHLATHQRDRMRTLERENAHLEQARRRLERILAIALRVAVGDDCDPLVLLQVLEEIDRKRGTPTHELVQLLRETAPRQRPSAQGGKQEAAA